MRLTTRLSFALAGTLLLAGCLDQPASPRPLRLDARAAQVISDAGHSAGNQHFFFLPPLVSSAAFSGEFDRDAAPTVRICEWAGSCIRTLVEFATVEIEESEALDDKGIKVKRESYVAKWKTRDYALSSTATYRISVLVAGTELGFADVDVVPSQGAARNVNTNEYIPLVEDQTLRIPFRIEKGAVFKVGAAGGTLSTADGNASLVVPPGMFSGEVGLTIQPAPLAPETYAAASLIPGTAYDLGPSGPLPPPGLTAVLRYDPANLGGADPASLVILTLVGDKWAQIPNSVVDQGAHTVSAPLTHFSVYVVGTATVATIDPRGLVVVTGTTGQLNATIGPNRFWRWVSLNPNIATIASDGKVTGVLSGVAEIVLVTSPDGTFIEGYDRIFVRVVDPGQLAWTRNKEGVVFNHLFGIHGTSKTDVWVVGTLGVIVHYDGTNTRVDPSGTTQVLRDVWAVSPSNVYAVGGNAPGAGVILHYNGSAWSTVVNNGEVFFGIDASDNYLFAVGTGGKILRIDPVTGAIATVLSSPGITFRGVSGSGSDVFAVGVNSSGAGVVVSSALDGDVGSWVPWTPPAGVTVGALNAVWSDPFSPFVVVAGDNGLVIGSPDLGGTWIAEPTSFPTFRAVTSNPGMSSALDVYLGGDRGTMTSGERCLCGTNGDEFVSGTVSQGVTSLWTDPDGLIWGVGLGGLIFQQNTVYGHTFKALAQGQIFSDVWASSNGRVLLSSGTLNSEIITTSSFGADGYFSTLLEWNGNGFNGLNANETAGAAYAVGPFGSVFRQTMSTGVWTRQSSGTTQHLLDAWVSNSDVTYVVGNGGTVLRTANHGVTWSSVATGLPTNVDYTQVWGFGDNDVIVAASSGAVYRTTNGGGAWTLLRAGPGGQYVTGLWASDANNVFMAMQDLTTGHGAIAYSTGGVWKPKVDRSETRYLAGAWGTSPTDVFIAGSGGTVLHVGVKADGTLDVIPQVTGTTKDLFAVWGATSKIIFVAGTAGTVYTGTRP